MTETLSFPGLGLSFELNRVAFTIGNLPVYWYGIMIATGFLLGMVYVFKRSKESIMLHLSWIIIVNT